MTEPEAVLVHGVGLDRHMWDAFVDAFDRPARSYDMIGHGGGPRPPGAYSLAQYAEQLAEVVGEHPADVIGFSMGALVAQRFAADQPGRVRRLVLVSGVFDRSPSERAAILQRVDDVRAGGYTASIEPAIERWFTADFAARHPEVLDKVRQQMLANDVDSYARAYQVFACGDAELVPRAAQVTVPTLVVTGGLDERSTPDMSRRLADLMPNASCSILPGLKHMIPMEAPHQLAALVSQFLNEEHLDD